MFQAARNESGQISILVLAISLLLLGGTVLVGAIAQVIVAQQRLNTKAEVIALAGAHELELNQEQACNVAKEFSATNYALNADCIAQVESVEILLSVPNPNPFLSAIIPKIYASSRAGIVANK